MRSAPFLGARVRTTWDTVMMPVTVTMGEVHARYCTGKFIGAFIVIMHCWGRINGQVHPLMSS